MAPRNRWLKIAQLTLFLLPLIGVAQTRISTVTRSVMQFGELERSLGEAKSAEAKSALLADDFEERLCSAPGTPVPREEWLTQPPVAQPRFSQQAVHLEGDVAVYSAIMDYGEQRDTIVDMWRGSGSVWKLAVRFRCPATGQKPAESVGPKRH